jgi:hypothetical protein
MSKVFTGVCQFIGANLLFLFASQQSLAHEYLANQGSEDRAEARPQELLLRPCVGIQNCNKDIVVWRNNLVGYLYARVLDNSGISQEYLFDRASRLVWSPRTKGSMTAKEALDYCQAKTDLGLKWKLPLTRTL